MPPFQAIQKQLQSIGLDLGDIVQMQAFLTGDPAKGREMDVDGWNETYKQFFGPPSSPISPSAQLSRLPSSSLPPAAWRSW